ncbi:processed acidic surface protein [Halalkalibacter urbisdiaboli]|uniref:processed acidic surface protein n=1 Tax=Halalkalibacter urbisdiaboli TaxID=1960589 RepID=UPI000B43141E|nr:processed acidic surface protein [Halalkalibacter urbisdiaboli]
MKRLLSILIIVVMVGMQFPLTTVAQINHEEIEAYLSPIGWSASDLENYLQDYFDMSIEDFETFEELKAWIGTPITAENRQELLTQYNMSLEELEALLAEYGESVDDYYFLEDLDAAIDFYTNYSGEMDEVVDFFALLGITDEELERVFLHLSQLDEETVEQQMAAIEERIMAMEDFSDATELTEAQKQEIASLFTDMLAAFKMSATFYLETNGQRDVVSLTTLLGMESLNGQSLLIEFYDHEGNLLLDMNIDENLFTSNFITEMGHLLPEVPHLAHAHPLGQKMPETASPYVGNMLFGAFLMILSIALYVRYRKLNHAS